MTNRAWVSGTGPMSGRNVIGEVTESIQKFVIDGWHRYTGDARPPRIEEDLTYEPMDRNEQVVYVYMYRVAANPNLKNQKRWRQAPVFVQDDPDEGNVYYHRPPVLVDLFYLVMVHSRFRSDAERLLGWLMLLLNEGTHLIYRPRKFMLPDGREVDSLGRTYQEDIELDEEDLVIEKVSVSLIDDLTVADAVNMFSLHEAPYRPFLTYRARIALDGPLVHAGAGVGVSLPRLARKDRSNSERRMRSNGRPLPTTPAKKAPPKIGPSRHNLVRDTDSEPDTN